MLNFTFTRLSITSENITKYIPTTSNLQEKEKKILWLKTAKIPSILQFSTVCPGFLLFADIIYRPS